MLQQGFRRLQSGLLLTAGDPDGYYEEPQETASEQQPADERPRSLLATAEPETRGTSKLRRIDPANKGTIRREWLARCAGLLETAG